MKTFFTADTHFGHARIIELCNRPFADVQEMNQAIVEEINATVSSRDRLVILGDICLGKLDESLLVLDEIQAGEIVLVPGNHDRWSLAYHHKNDAAEKREQFRSRYARDGRFKVLADEQPSAYPYCVLSDEWEGSLLDRAVFSHYPYDGDSQGEDRAGFLRAKDYGQPIVHGHVHTEWRIRGNQFNVGVDVNNYKPVSEEEIEAWIEGLS